MKFFFICINVFVMTLFSQMVTAQSIFVPQSMSQRKGDVQGRLEDLGQGNENRVVKIKGDRHGRIKVYFNYRIETDARTGFFDFDFKITGKNKFSLSIEENGRDTEIINLSSYPAGQYHHVRIPLKNLSDYRDRRNKNQIRLIGQYGGGDIEIDRLAIEAVTATAPAPAPEPQPQPQPQPQPEPEPQAMALHCTLNNPPSPSAPVISLNAAQMPDKTWEGKKEYDNTWQFYFNSSNSQYVNFPKTGYYVFNAQARSTQLPGGHPPRMQIAVDGRVVSESEIPSSSLNWYSSNDSQSQVEVFEISKGTHKVSVGFGNWSKALGQEQYQNLSVGDVLVYSTSAQCQQVPQQQADENTPLREIASARGIRFGAVLDTGIAPTGTYYNPFQNDEQNRNFLKTQFNHVVPGSSFLMDRIAVRDGAYNFNEADQVVNFAKQNNQTITFGHLVWYHFVPQWLINKNPSRQETKDFLESYIRTVMTRYKGRIKYWIVVNEAFSDYEGYRTESFWYQKLGPDYIDFAFRVARSVDPNAVLIYNDYDMDEIGRKSDFAYNEIKKLKAGGTPIDAVGFQAHLKINQPFFIKSMVDNMNRFAQLGLRVHVTEADVAIPKPFASDAFEIQAQFYRNTLKACLKVEACDSYTLFSTIEKYWWYQMNNYGGGAILNNDYSPKPAFEAIKKVMTGQDPLSP